LLVSIRRGEDEIIPHGDTVIYPGDYIIVLTDESKASKMNDTLSAMTEHNSIAK
jgi:Trk K+ transport system NAD-binding subunit